MLVVLKEVEGLSAIPGYSSVFAGIVAGAIIIYALYGLVVYALVATIFFMLFRKAKVKFPWLAFIPIGQLWPYFWTIKKSAWNILWFLVPSVAAVIGVNLHNTFGTALFVIGSIIPVVLGILWQIRLLKAFRMNPWWLLIMIGFLIPILNLLFELVYLILLGYMAFSSKVQYDPYFDGKGGGPGDNQGGEFFV